MTRIINDVIKVSDLSIIIPGLYSRRIKWNELEKKANRFCADLGM